MQLFYLVKKPPRFEIADEVALIAETRWKLEAFPNSLGLDDQFRESGGHGTGDWLADSSFAVDQTRTGIMARWRHAVELAMTDEVIGKLTEISRSRTEAASRVARAEMLLRYPRGFPCFVRFPCVHAVATTPAQRLGVLLRSLRPAVSAFTVPRASDLPPDGPKPELRRGG